MSALLRLATDYPELLRESESGPFVRFADVEEALRDSERLAWLAPVMDGKDEIVATRRLAALDAGVSRGLRGRDLVDYAREGCPE